MKDAKIPDKAARRGGLYGGAAALILLGAAAGAAQVWLWLTAQPVWTWLLPPAGAVFVFCLAAVGLTRRGLDPLQKLQSALREACGQGPGAQVDLEGIAGTEFYEIGWVFNQFSLSSLARLNALQGAGNTCRQLVPDPLLELLGGQDREGLVPGQTETLQGSLLVLMSGGTVPDAGWLGQMVETITSCGGAAVGYDLSRRALIGAFGEEEKAWKCACTCTDAPGCAAAVLHQEGALGFFGGKEVLYPAALIPGMGRRLAVLALLQGFGAKCILAGGPEGKLRLLGWDDGQPYYEDPSFRPAPWQAAWQKAEPLWAEALALYRARAFVPAMDKLARILHIMPQEEAARWYLFRCHALRCRPEEDRDLDLLWEGGRIP